MDYVTLDELKRTLELRGETFADGDLELAITAASEAVDELCGRRFASSGSDSTRMYRPQRERWVEIDDCASITTVESDGEGTGTFSPWAATDYHVEPTNAVDDGQAITALALNPRSSILLWPGSTTVRVTGTFGWDDVPAGVKQATKLIAARIVKRVREAPFGIAGVGADGLAVRIGTMDPDVKLLLRPVTRQIRLA